MHIRLGWVCSCSSRLVPHFEENGRSVHAHLQNAQEEEEEEGRGLRLSVNTSKCVLEF